MFPIHTSFGFFSGSLLDARSLFISRFVSDCQMMPAVGSVRCSPTIRTTKPKPTNTLFYLQFVFCLAVPGASRRCYSILGRRVFKFNSQSQTQMHAWVPLLACTLLHSGFFHFLFCFVFDGSFSFFSPFAYEKLLQENWVSCIILDGRAVCTCVAQHETGAHCQTTYSTRRKFGEKRESEASSTSLGSLWETKLHVAVEWMNEYWAMTATQREETK